MARHLALIFLIALLAGSSAATASNTRTPTLSSFPLPDSAYEEAAATREKALGHPPSLIETLRLRVALDPFNLIATSIFLCAVIHTFLCARFNRLARHFAQSHAEKLRKAGKTYPQGREPVSFFATIFHFLGEVEAVFGIWLIPLFAAIIFAPHHGWEDAVAYIDTRNFTEPMFVVVIMVIASTRPVVWFSTLCLRRIAALGGETPLAWWATTLTIAPLLGSFITEPAAMTIGAMLLGSRFFNHGPSPRLRYATLGLLFVNVSVGGTLTHFAAPPVLMVASEWHWNLPFMFTHFGWRAIVGILAANGLYLAVFWKELRGLRSRPSTSEGADEPIPGWIVVVHLAFLAWTVTTLHHPAFFIGAFLFFIAFTQATEHHQYQMSIRGPVLVGFFLAALVVHGGLQAWWIAPLLSGLGEQALFVTATVLTAFNDNAAITYLASQVPAFSPDLLVQGNLMTKEGAELIRAHAMEYAVVAGAVTGGGLTVIANAPNPAGQSLLTKYFGSTGISPAGLLAAALIPTLLMSIAFMVLPH
jgi:hypothetical protein